MENNDFKNIIDNIEKSYNKLELIIDSLEKTWDYTPYLHGFLNGILTAKGIIDSKEDSKIELKPLPKEYNNKYDYELPTKLLD